ncbi:MAG TPA: tetratricopeptide repeat protein [Allosphingosinicella sp.]|nr:tetratricopeptide repeat protein [Allosphingosinicella sp.]
MTSERLDQVARRIAIGLKLLLGLAGLAIVAAVAAMIWDAASHRGLVVESFQVPPALAAQGLSGEVVAGQIVDRLADLRGGTVSSRAVDELKSGWRQDYRVAIPQTGVSIGEVQQALRGWLGEETRISGEIYRAPAGLALTVRSDKGSAATFVGRESQWGDLVQRAAEDLFAKTDPYRHALYLRNHKRSAEALVALRRHSEAIADPIERGWALNGIAMITYQDQGRCAEAIPFAERAIALAPVLPNPVDVLGSAHSCLGQDQKAWDLYAKAVGLYRKGRHQDSRRTVGSRLSVEIDLAFGIGDFKRVLALINEYERLGFGSQSFTSAATYALSHDVRQSLAILARYRPEAPSATERLLFWSVRLNQSWAVEDWLDASRHLERVHAAAGQAGPYFAAYEMTHGRPLRAAALARSGRMPLAVTLLQGLPADCYDCAQGRAMVAEAGADRASADRWFAEAVRLGPRLPSAYVEWGQAKLARGDSAGALDLFERAVAVAPEFADAYKGKGDALSRLNRASDALGAYEASFRRTPRWGALHMAWGRALWRLGRHDEARIKFHAAASMDLSIADRARLQRIREVARTVA